MPELKTENRKRSNDSLFGNRDLYSRSASVRIWVEGGVVMGKGAICVNLGLYLVF